MRFHVGDYVRTTDGEQGTVVKDYGVTKSCRHGYDVCRDRKPHSPSGEAGWYYFADEMSASLALPLDEPVFVIVCACGEAVTPGHSHPADTEPVNVPADPDVEPQPYDMPSPEADALDRIADLWGYSEPYGKKLRSIAMILRETGRVL